MSKEYFDRSNEHRRYRGVQAIIRNMETVAEYSLVIIKVALCNRALGSVGNLSKDLFERRTLTEVTPSPFAYALTLTNLHC